MKNRFASIIILLIITGTAFASDPAEGFWLSVDDKTGEIQSGWEMYIIDGVLAGKMLSGLGMTANIIASRCRESYANFPVSGRVNQLPVLGTPWIFGLSKDNNGRWTNGHVINPENGSIYRCSIIHHPADGRRYLEEALEIRGQLLFFSGSQYWKRATREEASGLR